MKIATILDHIDLGSIALPEFQRGYVWNRDQVRGLMESLYRDHPVGSLLVWVTQTDNADIRGDGPLPPGAVKLLLDGQQRITSLYGIIRGRAPQFFDGNSDAFTGLYFNLDEEVFAFFSPLKMKDNPLWINVTELMKAGAGLFINRLMPESGFQANMQTYIDRLNAIDRIKEKVFHVEEVTGADKTVDVVVDIFNRVNSGGTKLSKGDLALAKICAAWPEARSELRQRLAKWRRAGFHFQLDWYLRCINTVVTGEALFSALKDVPTPEVRAGLVEAEQHVDRLLNLIAGRLGLDHDRVLGGRYAIPLMARYLSERQGVLEPAEKDSLLYWYVHSFLWGRYSGSTESKLNQDLEAIADPANALEGLVARLRQERGDLRLQANDFIGWSRGTRFYPLLYMLTRVGHALDWEEGIELRDGILGKLSRLELHHVFPKARLYDAGYDRPMVNALANFTFLTQDTNLKVSDRDPAKYLARYAERDPQLIRSHWIPLDPELWRIERYPDFLAARRELLAAAANDFLDRLGAGLIPQAEPARPVLEREVIVVPGGIESEQEERVLAEVNAAVLGLGLPEGELLYELADRETGQPLAILDLAWPEGLQQELSEPVALLLDESAETLEAANQAGFRYFTAPEEFLDYVRREILAEDRLEATETAA